MMPAAVAQLMSARKLARCASMSTIPRAPLALLLELACQRRDLFAGGGLVDHGEDAGGPLGGRPGLCSRDDSSKSPAWLVAWTHRTQSRSLTGIGSSSPVAMSITVLSSSRLVPNTCSTVCTEIPADAAMVAPAPSSRALACPANRPRYGAGNRGGGAAWTVGASSANWPVWAVSSRRPAWKVLKNGGIDLRRVGVAADGMGF